tara:strand:- start:12673 stop:13521 length:849 start_codon:yes stop_codon:yes gene_type:complete
VGLIQSNVADWLEWKSQQLEEWKKLSGILLEKQDELASSSSGDGQEDLKERRKLMEEFNAVQKRLVEIEQDPDYSPFDHLHSGHVSDSAACAVVAISAAFGGIYELLPDWLIPSKKNAPLFSDNSGTSVTKGKKKQQLAQIILDVELGFLEQDESNQSFQNRLEELAVLLDRVYRLNPSRSASVDSTQTDSAKVLSAKGKRSQQPSRKKAAQAYEIAMQTITDAENLTIQQLHQRISEDVRLCDMIPSSPDTFGTYLREAGIKRYSTHAKSATGSVVNARDL